jgi:outer membrane biosynthesis protein TonB
VWFCKKKKRTEREKERRKGKEREKEKVNEKNRQKTTALTTCSPPSFHSRTSAATNPGKQQPVSAFGLDHIVVQVLKFLIEFRRDNVTAPDQNIFREAC